MLFAPLEDTRRRPCTQVALETRSNRGSAVAASGAQDMLVSGGSATGSAPVDDGAGGVVPSNHASCPCGDDTTAGTMKATPCEEVGRAPMAPLPAAARS